MQPGYSKEIQIFLGPSRNRCLISTYRSSVARYEVRQSDRRLWDEYPEKADQIPTGAQGTLRGTGPRTPNGSPCRLHDDADGTPVGVEKTELDHGMTDAFPELPREINGSRIVLS
jgi:hypothetical protein